ncbi:DNA protecting protein DprA [Clostridia bacterium]|nr:DNA protecting protein DprA [Clostridia bacterium]
MKEEKYQYWLHTKRVLSYQDILKYMSLGVSAEEFFSASQLFLAEYMGWKEKKIQNFFEKKKQWTSTVEEYQQILERGIKVIVFEHKDYPKRLKNLTQPPLTLFYYGNLPKEDIPSVGIIGSRHCSYTGIELSKYFGEELAQRGIQIISGMACGIDAAGQKGALNRQGYSLAVLGCGVDVCYPKEEISLYHQLKKQGGLVSEFLPDSKPLSWHFPVRNRLISGFSDCILVVEAGEKSGSLITVDFALEQGKEVFVIPGNVTKRQNKGSNQLLHMGAGVALCVQDILDYFHLTQNIQKKKLEKTCMELEEQEKVLYSNLNLEPKHLDILAQETGIHLSELMVILMGLEQKNLVKQVSCSYYCRKHVEC